MGEGEEVEKEGKKRKKEKKKRKLFFPIASNISRFSHAESESMEENPEPCGSHLHGNCSEYESFQ